MQTSALKCYVCSSSRNVSLGKPFLHKLLHNGVTKAIAVHAAHLGPGVVVMEAVKETKL